MNTVFKPLVVAGIFSLSSFAPSAWSLPVTVGADDWFALSSVQTSLAPAALIDFTSASTATGGATTVTSAERYINDPYARPNTPEFSTLSNWLSVAPISVSTFSGEYSRTSLGTGTASGFGRLSWGDGLNSVAITSAFGDIVTVAPGGSLNVNLTFGGFSASTTERVTPAAVFDVSQPAALAAVRSIIAMGGTCEGLFLSLVSCSGPNYAFGVGVKTVLTLAAWQYEFQSESPFSQFGTGSGIDCAGAVICQSFSLHDGVGTPLVDGTALGDSRFSYLDTGGFFGASAPSSLSTGGGGKYYLGAQLSIILEPEISEWLTLAGCLAGPWGQSLSRANLLCHPEFIEPGLAFDMSHSLKVAFSGDAQYASQSGVFLTGHDVPEPGSLALVALALAGLTFSRRRKQ